MSRQQDILDARAAADEWAAERRLPPSGGYSGQWYQDGYLGGWWPDGWMKWWAAYGIAPGSLIGGLVVAHQYTSNPVDMNVMLESEMNQSPDQTDPRDTRISDLVTGLSSVVNADGEIRVALANARKFTNVKQMRPALQAIDSRLEAIRTQFLGD